MKILICLTILFSLSLDENIVAQQKPKDENSLVLFNGAQTQELLLKDRVPISFFATGNIKSIETKSDKYSLLIIGYKKGKQQLMCSNTYQWPKAVVKSIYATCFDSISIYRTKALGGKLQTSTSHNIVLEY
jgi:hypothetical protein